MDEQNNQLLMTEEERAVCGRLAVGEAPHSQRARAMLILADGASLAETAVQSGLTENQVKHWLGRFRSQRLEIFPETLRTAVPSPSPEPVTDATEDEPVPAKKKKKQKDGKDKKAHKGKKEKKKEKKRKKKKDGKKNAKKK